MRQGWLSPYPEAKTGSLVAGDLLRPSEGICVPALIGEGESARVEQMEDSERSPGLVILSPPITLLDEGEDIVKRGKLGMLIKGVKAAGRLGKPIKNFFKPAKAMMRKTTGSAGKVFSKGSDVMMTVSGVTMGADLIKSAAGKKGAKEIAAQVPDTAVAPLKNALDGPIARRSKVAKKSADLTYGPSDVDLDAQIIKREIGVMESASAAVGLLMLANMGTQYGSKIFNHLMPHRDDRNSRPNSLPAGYNPYQNYGGSPGMKKRQEKGNEDVTRKGLEESTAVERMTKRSVPREGEEADKPEKRSVMAVAGHALTLGFFAQTAQELLPGMYHEGARLYHKAGDMIHGHSPDSSSALPMQRRNAKEPGSADNDADLLSRRGIIDDTEESDILFHRRGFNIPAKYQPALQKTLGLTGAAVTLTMLASVMDAPSQHIANVISPQSPSDQFRRRSLGSEGKGENALPHSHERDLAGIIIRRAIADPTRVPRDDATNATAPTSKISDEDRVLLLPRALNAAALMPKVLNWAGKVVTVSMFSNLADPLVQGGMNIVAPIHPKSHVQASNANRLQKRSPLASKRDEAEVALVKRKGINIGRVMKKVTGNKTFKGIFKVAKALVF
ncbi:hypothetical protein CBS101457_005552 [Exobasidium rhododendri]|nr:hypothetical protein CBS101457_005552 [Exobasidium rhododendri]